MMNKQSKTHFGGSFPGDLDKSYDENVNSFEHDVSIATAESLADILPKTQQFYKFTNGDWSCASVTLAEDYIILKDEYENILHLNDVLGATVKRTNIRFLNNTVESQYFYRLRIHFLLKQPKKFSKSHSYCRKYSVKLLQRNFLKN